MYSYDLKQKLFKYIRSHHQILSKELRQIIDLWDSDKSQCFVITEFNNCFINQSLSLFINN